MKQQPILQCALADGALAMLLTILAAPLPNIFKAMDGPFFGYGTEGWRGVLCLGR